MKKKNWWRKKICGVYRISDKVSGKSYIGKSVDVLERWSAHGGIQNSDVSRAFWERPTDFCFEVLETCKEEELAAREDFWIVLYADAPHGVFNKQIPRGKKRKAAIDEAASLTDHTQALLDTLKTDSTYIPVADEVKPLSAAPSVAPPTLAELEEILSWL
jgi:hypothetical protein